LALVSKVPSLTGLSFQLRSVVPDDAEVVLKLRGQDGDRQRYLNPISDDIEAQKAWIAQQNAAENDYYFVIEDRFTKEVVGLIGLYNIADNRAEWGRWIVDSSSLAAVESVNLLMAFGFNDLGLSEIYCQTVADNTAVVKFHDGYAAKQPPNPALTVSLRGKTYQLVEHILTRTSYETTVSGKWDTFCQQIFNRRLAGELGCFEFHHIGIAVRSVKDAAYGYRLLGYQAEGSFTDPEQGVNGLFMTAKSQPRIELLENMEGSHVLDSWHKQSVTPYHFAYFVTDIPHALAVMGKLGIRQITPVKQSVYFGAPIVFLLLPNRFMIELMEKTK
jgi:RimJ/RimL family protein N-acetyltransferase